MGKILKRRPGDPCCGCAEKIDAWTADRWKLFNDPPGIDDEVVDEQTLHRSYVKLTGPATTKPRLNRESYMLEFRLLGQTTLTVFEESEDPDVDPGTDIEIDNTAGTVTLDGVTGKFAPAVDPDIHSSKYQIRLTPTHVHVAVIMEDAYGGGLGCVVTMLRSERPHSRFKFDGGMFYQFSIIDTTVAYADDAEEDDEPTHDCWYLASKIYPCIYSVAKRLRLDEDDPIDTSFLSYPDLEATGDDQLTYHQYLEDVYAASAVDDEWYVDGFGAQPSGWYRRISYQEIDRLFYSFSTLPINITDCEFDDEDESLVNRFREATGGVCDGFQTFFKMLVKSYDFGATPGMGWEPGDPTPLSCTIYQVEYGQAIFDFGLRYPDPEPSQPYPLPTFLVRMRTSNQLWVTADPRNWSDEQFFVDVNDAEAGVDITDGRWTWHA